MSVTMEKILATQDQIMSAMESLCVNFKKDGAERKTPAYIEKRLNTLDAYWNEFQTNHNRLCAEFEDMNHKYFSENFYQKALTFYNDVKSLIKRYVTTEPSKPLLKPATPLPRAAERFEAPATPDVGGAPRSPFSLHPTTQGTSSRVEDMLRKQKSNFKAFSRTLDSVDLESASERWEFEDILKTIQSRWSAIDSLHWEIDSEALLDNEEYELAFCEYEKQYNKMKRLVNGKMWSVSYKEKSTPKTDIPVFSGNYHQWLSFKDLFCEAVHTNNSLPNGQKMQLLKNKLRGEAERLVQHLRIKSDNYQICWDILNKRYNNMRLIFNSHVHMLLNIPTMQQKSATLIKTIHDTATECLNAIEAMGVETSQWDPLIVYILTQKLDSETKQEYIESMPDSKALPNLKEFLSFLETKFTSLEDPEAKHSPGRKQDTVKLNQQRFPYNENQKRVTYKPSNNNYHNNKFLQHRPAINHSTTKQATVTMQRKCVLCNNNHALFQCKAFLESVPENRRQIIDKHNLCKNCLVNHAGRECTSIKSCRFCNEKHNTLLHNAYVTYMPSTSTRNEQDKQAATKSNVYVANTPLDSMPKLLATAMVRIKARDGCHHIMRALVDPCAESSLISENAAQILGLPRIKRNCVVIGVGDKANNSKGAIKLTISALHSNFTFNTDAYVMTHVVSNLPSRSFIRPFWPQINKLPLADPEYNRSRPVDLILSVDVYEMIILPGLIRKDAALPIAQQTKLGWIISGTIQSNQHYCNVVVVDLKDIHKFWEIEDISDNLVNMSSDDYQCIQQYQSQTTRQPDGRYVVRLPLKPDVTEKLGESKTKAIAQFRHLEKRFAKNKFIAETYKDFIHEYIYLNHMIECRSNQTLEVYLPHHCVIRAESTTTMTRVVFNASAETSTGYSLNDLMYRGPNLQQDLLSLIIRWRQYKIAFTADIEKMFRQILVHKEDQAFQKIIWRDHPKQPLREYQLATVTYGTKAAPFLAMMTLKRLARDEHHNYPDAAEVVENSFYMDDLLHGHHDLKSAKRLKSDLTALLKSGGFNLRKWSSNKPELLDGQESVGLNDQTFTFRHQETTKTLGLQWQPREDQFMFQLKIEPSQNFTKRILLSNMSKVFDPLGWLSPVTTKLKLLFQEVWLLDLKWDDVLPDAIISKWKNIEDDIKNINNVKIQRWLQCELATTIELHGFCDASEKAYACVVYCKVNNSLRKGSSVVIVAAKSRLVPVKKTISLPRLELCAAVLLSKLMKTICQCLSTFEIKIFGWSDSTAVLGWLNGDTSRWKPFVANRVKQVIDIIKPSCWHYVPSKENPADCASRGITANQLITHPIWWHGPAWLSSFDENKLRNDGIYSTNEDIIKPIQINVSTTKYENDVIDYILSKHSDFMRASRVLAWALRMTSRIRNKPTYLTIPEIKRANILLIRHVQRLEFSEDIHYISKHQEIDPKSNLAKLRPFIDDQGVLRVGGRLTSANMQHNMKHPYILPHNHHLTEMLIDQAHKMTFHGGARLTLAWLRQQYWIVSGNSAVKKRLRKCVICRRQNPIKQEQLMGALPAARTNMSRPFYHTGVDFTGFVDVKSAKGRGVKCTKGYVAVFVCMATKAIHLELVSDLTSSAFIAALRRLAARRGAPGHIYSDNGTNFIKANRVLQEEFVNLRSIIDDQFYIEITNMKIEWHFNAPSWPSAGGLWEAAVKSLKYHLRRVIGEQKLTYEEFSTLLAQIEGCLNSRPLCPLSEDPDDLEFLTPAHFLAGGPTLTIVESEKDQRTRWQLTQKIYQDIWKRWRAEYLTHLNARSKWRQPQPNINMNDIVVIHDANLPPGKWALGRIIELHPGNDGLVRVVSVRTKNGIIKRPIVKLSVLPVREDFDQKISDKPEGQPSQASTSKPKAKGARNTGIFHYITLAMMLFTFLMSPVQCKYHVKNLTNNQSLYFDQISTIHIVRDEWKLVAYYDLEPYWQGNKLLHKYINHLDYLCTNTTIKTHCEAIILQLKHGYTELEHYNDMLSSQQFPGQRVRRRRGLINGVGNIARSLFGVLDDQFAQQYNRDIDLIKANQNHLAELWKNQTSIVESEFNVLKRIKFSIDKQHKMFTHHLNQLDNNTGKLNREIQSVESTNEFLLSAIAANGVLLNLKGIQDVLLDTVSEVLYGKFNIHLLKPDQLLKELSIISGKLPKESSLPIDVLPSELPKIYHLLKVKARMTPGYFIFEIKIPLVSRDNYDVYQVHAIPKKVGNNMVTLVPVSTYVAINLRKDSYIQISDTELRECIPFDTKTQLCPIQKPIHHMKTNETFCFKSQKANPCMTKTVTCHDSWVQLNSINTYLFFCCDPLSIRIICEDQITSDHLSNAGIIKLDTDCTIKGSDITVLTQKNLLQNVSIHADVTKIEIPLINHVFNQDPWVPVTETETIISDDDKELDDIGSKVRQLKSDTGLINQISYHDVHHYVAIYLLTSIVSIAILAYGVRLWRARLASRAPRAAAAGDGAPEPAAPPPALPARPARPALRGLTNAAYHYSVSDQCVSACEKAEHCVQNMCASESIYAKPVPSVRVNRSSSPTFHKLSFNKVNSCKP